MKVGMTMKLVGKQSWVFGNDIYIQARGTAVGPMEAKGPIGQKFDVTFSDLYCGEDTWELAERRLMKEAIHVCLTKANADYNDIDLFLAGDLLNQNATANYTARDVPVPFLCMYGACSTSIETLAVAAAFVDSGYAKTVLTATSSHNATAERQFRYPTGFGGQKPNSATFTVTGAGAALVSGKKSNIRITSATIGRVVDYGIQNPFDMGTAMAPAAAATIKQHFRDLQTTPKEYDLIVTGDLSSVGSPILKQMLLEDGYDISNNHNDCGLLIYHPDQDVFAGGSGCACCAVVTYGHLLKEMERGKLKKILVVATGALLSPTMIRQNESIPGIAHGIVLESTRGG